MPLSFKVTSPTSAVDSLTPHQINAELAEFISILNGIDKDNVTAGDINPIRVANDCWGSIEWDPLENVAQTTNVNAQDTNATIFPMPNNSGDPWIVTHVTQDGALEIELSRTHEMESGSHTVWYGIVVDGLLVGKTHWIYGSGGTVSAQTVENWRQGTVNIAVPVAAGTHKIEAVFGVVDPGIAATDMAVVIKWGAGAIWSREVRR